MSAPNIFSKDLDTMFQVVLASEGAATFDLDRVMAVKMAAKLTCKDGTWSAPLHIMALPSVIGVPVCSVYPEINWEIRPLLHGWHLPKEPSNINVFLETDVIVLWTRDGNFDNTPGSPFEPNHFAAMIFSKLDDDNDPANIMDTRTEQSDQKRKCTGNNPDSDDVQQLCEVLPKKLREASQGKSTQSKLDGFMTKEPEPDNMDETLKSVGDCHTLEFDRAEAILDPNPGVEDMNIKEEPNRNVNLDPFLYAKNDLTDNQKYDILTKKATLPDGYRFPKNVQGRRYNLKWEEQHVWLRYSVLKDGVYCAVCIAFCPNKGNLEFVSEPFKDWKNAMGEKRGRILAHADSMRHKIAVEKADAFINISDRNQPSILENISQAYQNRVEENRARLLSILDVVIVLGKRNIAFRGKFAAKLGIEDGNFNFFINWKSQFDPVLKNHLVNAPANAKYLSPHIQNELIMCIEQEIRDAIKVRCNEAPYFSVMADESPDAATQAQLSVCVRYTYWEGTELKITEDFIGFLELKRTDAATIADALISCLRDWGFNLAKLRGQGYDGCPTMSGEISGVQTRVRSTCPLARFVVCRSHNLNLVIVKSCQSIPAVRNVMAILSKITWFVCGSSKRKNIMKETLSMTEKDIDFDLLDDEEELVFSSSQNKASIPTLSETRWLSRVDTLTWLVSNYAGIIDVLDNIQEESSGQASADAFSYKNSLTNFEFLVAVVAVQHILGYIRPLSISLQATDCDLVQAFTEAKNLTEVMTKHRDGSHFTLLMKRAATIADDIGITPTKPRVSGRQRHRANADVSTTEDHYRVNLYYPFLDHVILQLNIRFPTEIQPLLYGYYLIPKKLSSLSDVMQEKIKEEYKSDIPNISAFSSEVERWKNKFSDERNVPATLSDALKECSSVLYPNIYSVLMLLVTLPVGSCSCERSFSALRRLKTWLRASMHQTRLCGLGMMHIHRNDEVGNVDPLSILKRWDASGHRRIGLAFSTNDK